MFKQMENQSIDIDCLQEVLLQSQTVQNEATDSTITQSGLMELRQTNVVTFPNRIESIAIDKSHIEKIRIICESVNEPSFPFEILLGVSTLFAGASLSALVSGISLQVEWRSILFYVISPMIAVGCFVAYLFSRKREGLSKKELAEHILEYIPEKTRKEEVSSDEH